MNEGEHVWFFLENKFPAMEPSNILTLPIQQIDEIKYERSVKFLNANFSLEAIPSRPTRLTITHQTPPSLPISHVTQPNLISPWKTRWLVLFIIFL